MGFTEAIKALKKRYKQGSNVTLANYNFRKLFQEEEENFDTFAVRVKHESRNCNFACTSDDCCVNDILVLDQIIMGTHNDKIRKKALENEWDLPSLIKHGIGKTFEVHVLEVLSEHKASRRSGLYSLLQYRYWNGALQELSEHHNFALACPSSTSDHTGYSVDPVLKVVIDGSSDSISGDVHDEGCKLFFENK